jgi:hypothetical protein
MTINNVNVSIVKIREGRDTGMKSLERLNEMLVNKSWNTSY